LKVSLRIIFRKLRKEVKNTTLNIIGISIGMVCFILIFAFVNIEASYDKFNENSNRLCRVTTNWWLEGNIDESPMCASEAGPYLKERFSQVVDFVRFRKMGSIVIRTANGLIEEDGMYLADSTFFNMFSFNIITGSAKNCLKDPNSIVLTRSMAEKYFGKDWEDKNILNKQFEFYFFFDRVYKITAVVEDPPATSHIKFNFMGSFTSSPDSRQANWNLSGYPTYILLAKGTSFEKIKTEFPMKIDARNFQGYTPELIIEPITDVYLKSNIDNVFGPKGSFATVKIVTLIGILIIIVACFNYINLSTARNAEKVKELGLRKVWGAKSVGLFLFVLLESLVIAFISFVVSFTLSILLIPYFNNLSGLNLDITYFFSLGTIISFLLLALCVGLFSGIYPAIVLSRARPINVVSGSKNTTSKGFLRTILTVLQFGVTSFLFGTTYLINAQLNFVNATNTGYEKKNILYTPTEGVRPIAVLSQEISKIAGVEKCATMALPVHKIDFETKFNLEGRRRMEDIFSMNVNGVDENFLSLFDIKLVAGSDFTRRSTNEYQFVLNEKAIEKFNLTPQEAIEKKLEMNWGIRGNKVGTIVGVVEDFNFASLHEFVEPLVLYFNSTYAHGNLMVRLNEVNLNVMNQIKAKWNEIVQNKPFDPHYLAIDYRNYYTNEAQLKKMATILSIISFGIACLGLISFSSFLIDKKLKEISIRKVFGANPLQLFVFISSKLARIGLLALIIGTVATYVYGKSWLSEFAYKTQINLPAIFLIGFIPFLVAYFAAVYQLDRASRLSPTDILRHE
jgi:putative ABC transport system permease protein